MRSPPRGAGTANAASSCSGCRSRTREDAALAFRDELGGDWPLAADPASRTAIAYGVFGVPETFVIAPDGSVAAKSTGAVTYEWLTDEIENALRTGNVE